MRFFRKMPAIIFLICTDVYLGFVCFLFCFCGGGGGGVWEAGAGEAGVGGAGGWGARGVGG